MLTFYLSVVYFVTRFVSDMVTLCSPIGKPTNR